MKKLSYLTVLALMLLAVISCNENENILPTNAVGNQLSEGDAFTNDVFVNGINQTYLQEMGMSEQELLQWLEDDNKSYDEELDSRLREKEKLVPLTSNRNTKGGYTFDRAELAGAIGYLLYNISQKLFVYVW